ncbi:MAG: FxsA family protein [Pseudomonadota bacterium]|nr:FxsA family protein [Pseudomonadota bacterium]
MRRLLLPIFILTPLIEMVVLIKVGQRIGALTTVGLVVLTAAVGLALLRREGLRTLLRAQSRLNSGQVPAQELLEGILLAAGGALLLTPGFITDAIGFICLVPPSRKWLAGTLVRNGAVVKSAGPAPTPPTSERGPSGGTTIEGEYRREP